MKRAITVLFVSFALGCGGGGPQKVETGPHALPPANPQAVAKMVQGVAAAKDGARDRAAQLLREAIAVDTNLWEARYDLGVVLTTMGDLAGAEEQLVAAAKLAPDSPEVAVALGEVQRRRGEHKAAASGLGDFLERHPEALDARTLYVAALRNSGQVDKAIAQGREVLVKKPGDAQALAELALCHLAKNERETAQLLAKQALDANAKSPIAHRAMGLIHLQEGDDAAAFQSFSKAAQEDPRDTTARMNMGTVLLRAGAYPKAEEQFRAILQATPEDAEAQIGLAASLRGQADPKAGGPKLEEARVLLTKVLDKDPHNVGALFNLGVLYTDFLKKPDEARGLFKRFLSDAPGDHPSRPEAEKYMSTVAATAKPAAPPAPPPGGRNEWNEMKRARLVVLAGMAACLALGWSIDGAFAQKGKPAPKPAATAKPAPAPKPPVTAKGKKDAGVAAIETSAPPPPAIGGKDAGAEKGGPTAERTLDGGAKVFRFGELEVEGRLRSPQLVYFLRRVRAEFAAGDLGHRSFMLELSQTRQSDNF